MERLISDKKGWVHYLTRPFDLLGASIWQLWYNSPQVKKMIGVCMPDVLFIQENKKLVRSYRIQKQLNKFQNRIEFFILHKPDVLTKLLSNGVLMNKKAEKILQNRNFFLNFQEVLDFVVEDAICATVLPYQIAFLFETLDKKEKKLKNLHKLALELRQESFYPALISDIIIPSARDVIRKNGMKEKGAEKMITISELLAGNFTHIKNRLMKQKKEYNFCLEINGKKEDVQWIKNTGKIIFEIEKISLDGGKIISGKTAHKGKVKGIAKVITDINDKAKFHKGDILVTVNSNPDLMPIILLSSAIITDEGGIACHASIISRELKKPCIIGTKIATKVLRDGDLVEVDADRGVVKIIKKNKI